MRKVVFSIVTFAVIAGGVCVRLAQGQSDHILVAKIPFAFYASDRALRAGEYTLALTQLAGKSAIKIQTDDGRVTAFVLTNVAKTRAGQSQPQLAFNQYQGHYFLAEISGLEETAVQKVVRSRTEKRIAMDAAVHAQKVKVTARQR